MFLQISVSHFYKYVGNNVHLYFLFITNDAIISFLGDQQKLLDFILIFLQVANSMVGVWAGPPAMMTIFRKMFGSHSCPAIIRQNNFSNFQNYFLLKVSLMLKSISSHSFFGFHITMLYLTKEVYEQIITLYS